MGEHGRKDGGDLDHPRDRPPEKMGEAFERTDVMFGEGVFAILCEPPRGLSLAQA
jgi:hypothetical protein